MEDNQIDSAQNGLHFSKMAKSAGTYAKKEIIGTVILSSTMAGIGAGISIYKGSKNIADVAKTATGFGLVGGFLGLGQGAEVYDSCFGENKKKTHLEKLEAERKEAKTYQNAHQR
jgi:hypothetical protein